MYNDYKLQKLIEITDLTIIFSLTMINWLTMTVTTIACSNWLHKWLQSNWLLANSGARSSILWTLATADRM